MSLLHLVHKSVAIKFADIAKNEFSPEALYAFRLAGVDAMGFLQIQPLVSGTAGAQAASEPYWINKDIVREIREVDLATSKETFHYTGKAPKYTPPKADPLLKEATPKVSKPKAPAKPKAPVLS